MINLKNICIFLLIIFNLIINIMSLENWGGMTKAQDDSTTIDEAIASAILAHEEDSESHMGAGESIENHRQNDVLDHPQGSVVADKRQVSQLEMTTCFESVAGWIISAVTRFNEFGYFYIATNTTVNNSAVATFEDGVPILCEHLEKNPLFQVAFQIATGAVGEYNLNLSLTGEIDYNLGFGFRVSDLRLYGLFNDGTDLHSVSLYTLSRNTLYVARAFINKSTGDVEFWLNGAQLGSIPFEQNYTSDETLNAFFQAWKVSGTGTVGLIIHQMTIARDF
jgi:hypothetical protein